MNRADRFRCRAFSIAVSGIVALCCGSYWAAAAERGTVGAKTKQERAARLVEEALYARVENKPEDSQRLLQQAIELSPQFAPLRWQLGDLHRSGKWVPFEDVIEQTSRNKAVPEYARQRDDLLRTVEPIVLNYPAGTAVNASSPAYLKVLPTAPRWLRKTFDLAGKPQSAQIRVLAVGKCEAFINGHQILKSGTQQISGTEKVSAHLRAGQNVIAVSLKGADSEQIPGLYAWLEGNMQNHSIFAIPSDMSWKVTSQPAEGWTKAGFDDTNWETVIPSPVPGPTVEEFVKIPPGVAEFAKIPPGTIPAPSPDLEKSLAQWCQANSLPEQARFHWMRLLQAQPNSTEAIKALGLVHYGDKLLPRDQLELAKKANREATAALDHWLPILRRVQADLNNGPGRRADAAAAKLREADLSSVAAFETLLAEMGNPPVDSPFTIRFVHDVLARLPENESTQALLRLAQTSTSEALCEEAIAALKARDWLSFIPHLMAKLVEPVKVQTTVREESTNVAVCQAEYFRKGIEVDDAWTETSRITTTGRAQNPLKGVLSARQQAEATANTIAADVARQKRDIDATNARTVAILQAVTGENHGMMPSAWWTWWREYNELLIPTNPVRRTSSFNDYVDDQSIRSRYPVKDCFAKGTPVWSATGLRPIETIRVGDLVLAQEVDSGELAFKIVLATSIRAPGPMLTLRVNDETLTSTLGHRYWIEGQGWRMAKRLKPGDRLHAVKQSLPITEVERTADQEAYNLVVEGFNSFFVGQQGLLVNDTGAPRPTVALVPGLGK